jgi:putative membrane protein
MALSRAPSERKRRNRAGSQRSKRALFTSIDLAISPRDDPAEAHMRSTSRRLISLACALVLSGAIAGCGADGDNSHENAQIGSDTSGDESGSRAPAVRSGSSDEHRAAGHSDAGGAGAANGGTGGANASGGAGSNEAARLSDAQIGAIATAANNGEIQHGKLALDRAGLSRVRSFALEMINEHSEAQERATDILETLNIAPMPNRVSSRLEEEAQKVATMLKNTPSADFDLAYVQSQVTVHTEVLMLIDDRLLPSATAPALRTDLMTVRTMVARHLEEAQALVVTLQAEGSDGGT